MILVYELQRDEDDSHVSGTGRVAYAVEWPDGSMSLWWPAPGDDLHQPQDVGSVNYYPSRSRVRRVHGHKGKTRLVRVS